MGKSGETTRLIDRAVQSIFRDGYAWLRDDEQAIKTFMARMQAEHSHAKMKVYSVRLRSDRSGQGYVAVRVYGAGMVTLGPKELQLFYNHVRLIGKHPSDFILKEYDPGQ